MFLNILFFYNSNQLTCSGQISNDMTETGTFSTGNQSQKYAYYRHCLFIRGQKSSKMLDTCTSINTAHCEI